MTNSDLSNQDTTNYEDAYKRAFGMADISYANNYDSGCQTVYVFLTDGACTAGDCGWPAAEIERRKTKTSVKRAETHIVIGFGDAVKAGKPRELLQELACKGEGIFEYVPDRSGDSTAADRLAEFTLARALSRFSSYFQTKNALKKRELVTYTEIYGTSWDGVSQGMNVATAAVPVYDKNETDRWRFLGVMAIDVTVCKLEKKLVDKNADIQKVPALPEETKFPNCKCATSYTYNGEQVSERTHKRMCVCMCVRVYACACMLNVF